jgi:hypothetical protein
MAATYQVWDDDTGNRVASYGTRDEAVAFLHVMLAENGADGVRDLAVIEYPADGSDPVTVLEGVDFLTQRKAPAQS